MITLIIKSVLKVFDIIFDTVEKEYTDEKPLKSRLMALSIMLDNNEITQEEYDAEEKKILEHLQKIRNYVKERYGEDYEDVDDDEEEYEEEYEEDSELQTRENEP